MASALDVSVVICAYTEQRWDDLLAAVASVRRQSLPAREIIVVIDHNPTLLERTRATMPDVILLENREPRGLSGARNTGIAIAQSAIIAFLDDDAIAEDDWLERLVEAYHAPQVLGVGGAIQPLWTEAAPAWFPAEFHWVVGCTYRGLPETTAPVRNLIGANMSLRRSVFEQIGGFRQGVGRIGTLPMGCEETELCIQARQHWPHGVMLYEPRARVWHRVTPNRARWSYFRSRCYAEGLSKAQVTQLVGSGDGLASERTYTLQTLPLGVLRGIADTFKQREAAGMLRAGAIVAGLAITTAGYIKGTIAQRLAALKRPRALYRARS